MTQAILKTHPKNKDFYFLYLKEVPVVYASIQKPKKKFQSEDMEWALTAFVDDETRAYLEDEILVNKSLSKVGKDKNKKRQIKYPLSSQRDDGKDVYDPYKDLNGISLTLNTKKKDNSDNELVVVDNDGNPLTDLVGNGSICNIKCFGYRNKDEQLVIQLNLVQVVDLKPFEGGGGDGSFTDDELGIRYNRTGSKEVDKAPANDVGSKSESNGSDSSNEDNNHPF